MIPVAGTYPIGPTTGDLVLRTSTEGPMAAAGHDLVLVVEDWDGQLVIGETPAASSLRVTVNLGSLAVRSSHGGAKPMSERDRAAILKNAAQALGVSSSPEMTFTSTAVEGTWQEGRLEGSLTLHGRTEVQQFEVDSPHEGEFRLTGTISQTRFGIKPYSLMMGALRVGDEVDVEVSVRL